MAIGDYRVGVGIQSQASDGVTGSIALDKHRDIPAKDLVIGPVRNRCQVTVSAVR